MKVSGILLVILVAIFSGCLKVTDGAVVDDSPICVAYIDVGDGDIVPGGDESIKISVNTLYKQMDINIPMKAEIEFEGLPAKILKKGVWDKGEYLYDVGNTWRFEPVVLTKEQSKRKAFITLSGAKTVDKTSRLYLHKEDFMMPQTFPICFSKEPLIKRLRDIGEWMIKNPSSKIYNGSIFIEGYNQRTLLGLYEITGEKRYLRHVRKWVGELLDSQRPEGFWLTGTGEYRNVYFADTGSALGLLVNYYKYASGDEKKHIESAFDKYSDFILEKSKSKGGPFIHEEGWMGIGYQRDDKGKLSEVWNKPYTISTALTGASVFATHYYLDGNQRYKEVAVKACDWLLGTMLPNGHMPYIRDDAEPDRTNTQYLWWRLPYNTSAYAGEGFISAWTFIEDENFRKKLASGLKPHVEWLLYTQNDDGSWAKKGMKEQYRSHGVVNFLVWYYYNIEKDPRIARAVQKYCCLILDEKKSKYLEIKVNAIATSLVGRALVDVIKPGADCRRWK
ncbi:MAG: hypothetical protein ACYSSI_06150 [Planctomycetota bacterium]|jgi:hypothetical protein